MVPPILRKIRRNGPGLSVPSVIVHARLLFVKTTYWVAVIVMPPPPPKFKASWVWKNHT